MQVPRGRRVKLALGEWEVPASTLGVLVLPTFTVAFAFGGAEANFENNLIARSRLADQSASPERRASKLSQPRSHAFSVRTHPKVPAQLPAPPGDQI